MYHSVCNKNVSPASLSRECSHQETVRHDNVIQQHQSNGMTHHLVYFHLMLCDTCTKVASVQNSLFGIAHRPVLNSLHVNDLGNMNLHCPC